MASNAQEDAVLTSVIGAELESEVGGARYRIVSRVGEGAMGIAYYALRMADGGQCPVVVKLLRPFFVSQWADTAHLIIQKEAIALGRLNERVPPTPFVVRFIDTGGYAVPYDGRDLVLPYVVVEYVHGGPQGTTLTQRVAHTIGTTKQGFDAHRTANLVEALSAGLVAVHDVGVIHRDLKPDNVLCCGFSDDEIFKIADFGVARPIGVAATFGGFVVGTMGYAAPELATMDQKAIGAWSDVFSLAAIVYFALTGEEYFDVRTPGEAIVAAVSQQRRSIRDSPALHPEIRADTQACNSIDHALASATSGNTDLRPRRADALATMLVPWLRSIEPTKLGTVEQVDVLWGDDDRTKTLSWEFSVVKPPGSLDCVIRDAAWDSDGRCMVATNQGLAFYNGSSWCEVDHAGLPNPRGIRFVRRVGPGQWLVGGEEATFATYTTKGVSDMRRFEGWDVEFERFSGDIDDLAVLVGRASNEPISLCALSGRRWLKPLQVPDVARITSIARVEDAKWLITGRDLEGAAYIGLYSPLDWELLRIHDREPGSQEGPVRAFLASAGQHERGVGLAVGTQGAVVWRRERTFVHEHVAGGVDLSATAVDAAGRGWAAGPGGIWQHTLMQSKPGVVVKGKWDRIWTDPSWKVPVAALFADPGLVIAMTADGGVLEGRAQQGTFGVATPPASVGPSSNLPTSVIPSSQEPAASPAPVKKSRSSTISMSPAERDKPGSGSGPGTG